MTQAVASGAHSNVSKLPGQPLRADKEGAPDAWKRDSDAGPAGADAKPALKPGIGPRPGNLDHVPVVARSNDELPQWSDVGWAARLAFRQHVSGHKGNAIAFPKTTAILTGLQFLKNLFFGNK